MTTLFEKFGGDDALQAATEEFYRRMLRDESVANFFADVDMEGQIAKQKAFLTVALGGPNNYTGLDMNKGHAALRDQGMKDAHVDTVIKHLGETLLSLGISQEDVDTVAERMEGLRDQVMGRAE
ncbi:MAG: group 1 truncated hemoglobin [Planctomycetota bacterium]